MSVDLNFWKYQSGLYLDNAMVYQKACCDKEKVVGLETLPIEAIFKETAAAFHEWTSLDPFNYERKGHGSFQISITSQTVRFDCYSMEQADMKRFSSILSKFGCPLYDPQQGVRFDKICAFLADEAGEYKTQVEQEFSRLLPHLEILTQIVTWDEYVQLSKTLRHIQLPVCLLQYLNEISEKSKLKPTFRHNHLNQNKGMSDYSNIPLNPQNIDFTAFFS